MSAILSPFSDQYDAFKEHEVSNIFYVLIKYLEIKLNYLISEKHDLATAKALHSTYTWMYKLNTILMHEFDSKGSLEYRKLEQKISIKQLRG